MTVIFNPMAYSSKITTDPVELSLSSSEEDKTIPLAVHIPYENHPAAVENQGRYKLISSDRLDELLYSTKIKKRQVGSL